MNVQSWFGIAIACCVAAFARAQPRTIDTAKSVMTVHVYKSGVFSAFGHDHEIAAPISAGTADPAGRRVELHARATALRVSDAKVSDKDREEIQKTMLSAEVLDAERYPEITFRSTTVDAAGAWKVTGDLTLHGQTHPVTFEVREADGHYVGTARFKQTEFGIKPVKIAGGAVRVKDELQIDFNIQLAH